MKLSDARDQVIDAIDAGNAVELISSSGVGKSELVDDLIPYLSERDGEEWGFSTMFLATQSPPELGGYVMKGEMEYEGEKIATSAPTLPPWMVTSTGKPTWAYKRGILFLDEYGQGEADVKRASAELLLNKRLGPHTLGGKNKDGWGVIAASNRSTDKSGVTKSFDFVINRRKEIHITPDLGAWVDWATKKGIPPLIIAFASTHPQIVFDSKHPEQQGPWCTPRSLVKASNELVVKARRNGGEIPEDPITIESITGNIGAGAAASLFSFVKLEREMPKFERICAAPLEAKVPKAVDAQMLVCYNLAHRVDAATAKPVIQYVNRLGKEFAVTFARAAVNRLPTLVVHPAFHAWAKENASLMSMLEAFTPKKAA